MILGVHHVQITIPVGSEAQAREFYCGLLGLSELPKPQSLVGRGGFWLGAPGIEVHVGVEEAVDRLKTKAHVAYEVSDLDRVETKLRDLKFEISGGPPIPGIRRFESRDPFGNRIEFVQRQRVE